MKKMKSANVTYIGDGSEKVKSTLTNLDTGTVHAVNEGGDYMCGSELWYSHTSHQSYGKADDVTCKRCLRSIRKN